MYHPLLHLFHEPVSTSSVAKNKLPFLPPISQLSFWQKKKQGRGFHPRGVGLPTGKLLWGPHPGPRQSAAAPRRSNMFLRCGVSNVESLGVNVTITPTTTKTGDMKKQMKWWLVNERLPKLQWFVVILKYIYMLWYDYIIFTYLHKP